MRVCAHAQALAQCRGWLDEHLPDAERIAVNSNAEGARRSRDESGSAAIAGDTAAEVYGLNLLVREIEDRTIMRRVFWSSAARFSRPAAPTSTTLLLSARDTAGPGALLSPARAAGGGCNQHDTHRVAPLAARQMGLRVLH